MGWHPRDPNAYEVPVDNSHPENGLFHCPLPLGGSIVMSRAEVDELGKILGREEEKKAVSAGASGYQRPLTKAYSINLHQQICTKFDGKN